MCEKRNCKLNEIIWKIGTESNEFGILREGVIIVIKYYNREENLRPLFGVTKCEFFTKLFVNF